VPVRPSKLWKDLPVERRLPLADAFWRDEQGVDQQIEAIVTLARRLKFRTKSVQALSIERARTSPSFGGFDAAGRATRASLRAAPHGLSRRPGIPHENGSSPEEVAAPDPAAPPGREKSRRRRQSPHQDLDGGDIDPTPWRADSRAGAVPDAPPVGVLGPAVWNSPLYFRWGGRS
jgi:hypothetical protein